MPDSGDLLAVLLAQAPHDFEPDLVPPRPAWHAKAACRGVGPAVFYPERGASVDPARACCAQCPVTVQCTAAGADEVRGIWAGSSGRQRRIMRLSAA